MVIHKNYSSEVPNDAVILSPEEAYAFHMKIINNWETQSDVWALRYAPGILGSMSALSGIYINNYFRKKLKLGSYGRLSSYLPIVILPAIVTVTYHKAFVQRSVILDTEVCPVCTEIRAAAFQTAFGVIYPTVLAPFAALMFATRHYTYRLPSITENPKDVFALLRKMVKNLVPFLGAAAVGQSLIAMYLTYKEMMNFYQLQGKLQDIERNIDNDTIR